MKLHLLKSATSSLSSREQADCIFQGFHKSLLYYFAWQKEMNNCLVVVWCKTDSPQMVLKWPNELSNFLVQIATCSAQTVDQNTNVATNENLHGCQKNISGLKVTNLWQNVIFAGV